MHADFSVTPICACTRVPPWASINRDGGIKKDGKVGKGLAEKERDEGTREQRKEAVVRRGGERRKVPKKTDLRLNIPHPVTSCSLLHLSVHTAGETRLWEWRRDQENEQKSLFALCESICVCWRVVVVFSDLCRLWLSSSSWVFGAVFCTERIRNLSSPQVFRRCSLTWGLQIRSVPPQLTPPNSNTFYPCKWNLGWMTKTNSFGPVSMPPLINNPF